MLDAASPQMQACIYLGINCGFYAKDCSDLRVRHMDGEFISFAREKTGIDRRVWLWPETRKAIAESMAPENADGRVFLSRTGQSRRCGQQFANRKIWFADLDHDDLKQNWAKLKKWPISAR